MLPGRHNGGVGDSAAAAAAAGCCAALCIALPVIRTRLNRLGPARRCSVAPGRSLPVPAAARAGGGHTTEGRLCC